MESREPTHRRNCTPMHKFSQKIPRKENIPGSRSHTQRKTRQDTLVCFQHYLSPAPPLPWLAPTVPARSCAPLHRMLSAPATSRSCGPSHLIPHRLSEVRRPLSPASPPPSEVPAPPHRPSHHPSEVRRLLTCLPPTGEMLSPLPCLPPAMVRSCNPSPTVQLPLSISSTCLCRDESLLYDSDFDILY
jgi:hypothetical protein